MGSILGALSRANATLGSAAGAKLAVWECVEISHGLSALLAVSVFQSFCPSDRQPPTSAVALQQTQQKEEKEKGRRGNRKREGWRGKGIVISQQCQKSQPRPCLSIEASLGRTMDFPAI